MNDKKVNALDICFIRTLTLLTFSFIGAKCFGQSFFIEPKDRKLLAVRSLIGTIGFTCMTFGVAMIPLVAQNTIFNTSPFWATLLAWCIYRERITYFEICAMIMSFGAICLIALSKKIIPPEESDVEDEVE